MPTPMETGDALHRAVLSIERLILRSAPTLGEKTFLIEDKKVIRVNGVRHEIDIFVTVDAAPGYAAVYIFECKNWANPVGKNEIVVFSEKIKVLNAAHGYFVAKSFTEDARAQANLDGRLTLLLAAEHDFASLAPLGDLNLHSIAAVAKHAETEFKKRGSTGSVLEPFELDKANATMRGETLDLNVFIRDWANKTIADDTLKIRTERMAEGVYERKVESKREFPDSDFIVNGLDMGSAAIVVDYHLHVYHPPIISRFDVESRGRFWSFAPFVLPEGGTMQMAIVEGQAR
jgi:hypothetical protein